MRYLRKILSLHLMAFTLVLMVAPLPAQAGTRARQFQLNVAPGGFFGTEGIGAAFDLAFEPEFFFTQHNSLSLRMDFTVGKTDSFSIGSRWRYYFDMSNERISLYVGLGIGTLINFNGPNFGDATLPVFGWQYDFRSHVKLGSEISFNILFNSNNVIFATRLMPIVVKFTF